MFGTYSAPPGGYYSDWPVWFVYTWGADGSFQREALRAVSRDAAREVGAYLHPGARRVGVLSYREYLGTAQHA